MNLHIKSNISPLISALAVVLFLFNSNITIAQSTTQLEEIPLWRGTPPDGPGPQGAENISAKGSYTNISAPKLIVHRPDHPNGIAVLVISGGGYAHIEAGKESTPAANWLQSEGITAFELIYRLPGEGWTNANVPFEDGQRAMRIIRSLSKKYGYDTHRIGIMGFSAGGHLAGMTATTFDEQFYPPVDDIDRISARPDFAALLYPVITMLPPYDHTHSEKEIIGKRPDKEAQKRYSVQLHVLEHTPPAFLAQAEDDPISNVENSRLMYAALQNHQIPAEIHLFPTGGHGWGMGAPGSPEQEWPKYFKAWLKKMNIYR
ncbi:Acetyl esterase/lipase [Mucilaginibacter lappiensis]|uniref:Acetyl esterase/lipase n=1 Tax=Mucilaginibacter lappiensis TaxID=354630 RepID=A0ABR6PQX9_9SPHI|nr:alpha/beta hydrolase [Mucilaginibacter lappiensis]MBB6112134.1 acetyl esterase/lipase [Mucilaginibacter lappiensis]SIR93978.1 Acetyl esterase/lipase [Mucilaginibacter lappiensis]